MNRKWLVVGIVVVAGAGIGAVYSLQPPRLTAETLEKARAAQEQVDQIETQRMAALQADKTKAAPAAPKKEQPMSDTFKVQFECSNGTFVIECHADWAPLGAERFKTLVDEKFFDDVRFFRVVDNFVVQFGISGDPEVAAKWRSARIKDDPVKETNAPGTIVFATSGPNSRTTQLFINLGNNARLDGMGFSPFGKVVEGMDVVKAINGQYQDAPSQLQQEIQMRGNAFLNERFPELDYIKSAKLVK